jgi:hypothetical protein
MPPKPPKTIHTVPQINPYKGKLPKVPRTTQNHPHSAPNQPPTKENCLTPQKPPKTIHTVPQINPYKGKLPNAPKPT